MLLSLLCFCVLLNQCLKLHVFVSITYRYLLREIKKVNLAVPEAEVPPVAPAPKNVLEIMVGAEIY